MFILTSNLASEEILDSAPRFRAVVDKIVERPEEYEHVMSDFIKLLYPTLKQSLKRDEFLGRINKTIIFLPLNEEEVSTCGEYG